MSLRNRFGAFFFALTFVTTCAYSFAGQSTTDSACVTTDARPPVIKSFLIEHRVDVTTIKSTIQPKLPQVVLDAIFSGQNEVRSRITYDQETGILENNLFLRLNGAELPTIDPAILDNIEAVRFGFLDVDVDTVYTSCQPSPTVLAVGCVVAGVDIFLPPAGAPYAFSFGYTTEPLDEPFNNIVSDTVGLGLLFQDHAPGSITFTDHHGHGHKTRSAAHCPR